MAILVTGGAGFIGSNFIKFILENSEEQIINFDLLTYASNISFLDEVKTHENYSFIQGDIVSEKQVDAIFNKYNINTIINFAAESHVDNSIESPNVFVRTNVLGTANLLNIAKKHWGEKIDNKKFIQISTDEVYGSLSEDNKTVKFDENSQIKPNSPYSASKASADLLALSYYHTYKFPVIITRCSNNYGHNQHIEKLIPLMIKNALTNKKLPVYGDGKNIRDWIFVQDHINAIHKVMQDGEIGEVYNIGANEEHTNIGIVEFILKYLNKPLSLIEYVEDRKGHDRRYAIDASKIRKKLNWTYSNTFENNMIDTIEFYKEKLS